MLTLTLLRHAKSSWGTPGLDDHARPLAPRGIEAAPRIGRWLADWFARNGDWPDLVLCSDAVRTRATLELIRGIIARPTPTGSTRPRQRIVVENALYLVDRKSILAQVASAAHGARHVMVIGHNPGLHELALALIGTGDATAVARLARKFPTAAAVILAFDAEDFAGLQPSSGRLLAFATPKDLD